VGVPKAIAAEEDPRGTFQYLYADVRSRVGLLV
jgi:hypothetical protein